MILVERLFVVSIHQCGVIEVGEDDIMYSTLYTPILWTKSHHGVKQIMAHYVLCMG